MSSFRYLKRAVAAGLLLCLATPANSARIDPKLILALKQSVEETSSFPNSLNALTWLTDMSTRLEDRVPDTFYRIQLLNTVHAEATRAGLRPELVLALIEVESNFDRFAVSRSNARGLMQVMPFWKKEIGHPRDNLFHPGTNLRYGCTILKFYLDMAEGDIGEALALYNGRHEIADYLSRVMLSLNETWLPASYGFNK